MCSTTEKYDRTPNDSKMLKFMECAKCFNALPAPITHFMFYRLSSTFELQAQGLDENLKRVYLCHSFCWCLNLLHRTNAITIYSIFKLELGPRSDFRYFCNFQPVHKRFYKQIAKTSTFFPQYICRSVQFFMLSFGKFQCHCIIFLPLVPH